MFDAATRNRGKERQTGRRTAQHAQSDKLKPFACLTRDSNPQLVLRQSIQTPMKCHRHTRCNLSIPHCLLSGGGCRFRTGGRKATSYVADEISGGFGTNGSIWRLRSEGRRFACMTNHVPSDRTGSHAFNHPTPCM
jgi:hypothetical protein